MPGWLSWKRSWCCEHMAWSLSVFAFPGRERSWYQRTAGQCSVLSVVLVGQRVRPAHCGGGRLGSAGRKKDSETPTPLWTAPEQGPHASNMCRWMWGGWGRTVGEVGAQAPNEHARVPGLYYNLCESSKNQNKGPAWLRSSEGQLPHPTPPSPWSWTWWKNKGSHFFFVSLLRQDLM